MQWHISPALWFNNVNVKIQLLYKPQNISPYANNIKVDMFKTSDVKYVLCVEMISSPSYLLINLKSIYIFLQFFLKSYFISNTVVTDG